MKLLAAEQFGLAFAGDSLSLLGLGPGEFLHFHRLLLRLLEHFQAFEVPCQVNQIEISPIGLGMQHNRIPREAKITCSFCVARVFLNGCIFSIQFRQPVNFIPKTCRTEQPPETLPGFPPVENQGNA